MADEIQQSTEETIEPAVTDTDIEEIFERGPAGVADLMAAYEPVAQAYYSVVLSSQPSVTYAIDTIER